MIGEDAQKRAGVPNDLFEMANLPKSNTGIDGCIRITTQEAAHAPRVKYFTGRPTKSAPYMVVTIAPEPEVIENSQPEHVRIRFEEPVKQWIKANYEKLRDFWYTGGEMMDDEVSAMVASLVKWPIP